MWRGVGVGVACLLAVGVSDAQLGGLYCHQHALTEI